jgi:hypothetical protein
MRHGFKIFDSDTHLNPLAETLEPYFDAVMRKRLPEWESCKVPFRVGWAGEILQPPYRLRGIYLEKATAHPCSSQFQTFQPFNRFASFKPFKGILRTKVCAESHHSPRTERQKRQQTPESRWHRR